MGERRSLGELALRLDQLVVAKATAVHDGWSLVAE